MAIEDTQILQNLRHRLIVNPQPSECYNYLWTFYKHRGKSGSSKTKKAIKRSFHLYGIEWESEMSTLLFQLNEGKTTERMFFMNLAEKMKKVMQGVKVVDKIDLDKIPNKVHPEKASKEERKDMRKLHELREQAHNLELLIADLEKQYDEEALCKMASERKQKSLRKEYLEKRMKIREQYDDTSLDNNVRQERFLFQGIRPEHMDVVHFHIPQTKEYTKEIEGLALARDENHYYIAVDLYDHPEREDNISSCMDENPDGTFEGIWPKCIVLKKASRFEEWFVRNLVEKYADDIEKAKAYLDGIHQRDLDESIALSKEIHSLTKEIDKHGKVDAELQKKRAALSQIKKEMEALMQKKEEPAEDAIAALQRNVAESQTKEPEPKAEPDIIDFSNGEEDLPLSELTDYEQRFQHLAYIRGKRTIEDMSYPFIETNYKAWLRFRLMANIARLFDKVTQAKALTYVLSEEYLEEMKSRAKTAYRGMMPQDLVGDGEVTSGVLVFKHQGFEDTIVYDINNITQLSVLVAYIREGSLMFYEAYSEQEVLGRPRIDNYMRDSMRECGTDANRMFAYVRNFVVCFLAMERDMERTMKNFVADGKGEQEIRKIPEDGSLRTDDNEDVVIRDANWYSSISIDHLIPVNGYVSHRWTGKGKDKVLQEVWVRPHSRNGYHREAGVTKTNNEKLDTSWD